MADHDHAVAELEPIRPRKNPRQTAEIDLAYAYVWGVIAVSLWSYLIFGPFQRRGPQSWSFISVTFALFWMACTTAFMTIDAAKCAYRKHQKAKKLRDNADDAHPSTEQRNSHE
jgi:hypothetical protein